MTRTARPLVLLTLALAGAGVVLALQTLSYRSDNQALRSTLGDVEDRVEKLQAKLDARPKPMETLENVSSTTGIDVSAAPVELPTLSKEERAQLIAQSGAAVQAALKEKNADKLFENLEMLSHLGPEAYPKLMEATEALFKNLAFLMELDQSSKEKFGKLFQTDSYFDFFVWVLENDKGSDEMFGAALTQLLNQGPKAIPPLLELIRTTSRMQALAMAAVILGRMEAPGFPEAMLERFNDPATTEQMQRVLLGALEQAKTESATDLLKQLAESTENPQIKEKAHEAFLSTGSEEAIASVLESFANGTDKQLQQALEAVARSEKLSSNETVRAVLTEHVQTVFADGTSKQREFALEAVGSSEALLKDEMIRAATTDYVKKILTDGTLKEREQLFDNLQFNDLLVKDEAIYPLVLGYLENALENGTSKEKEIVFDTLQFSDPIKEDKQLQEAALAFVINTLKDGTSEDRQVVLNEFQSNKRFGENTEIRAAVVTYVNNTLSTGLPEEIMIVLSEVRYNEALVAIPEVRAAVQKIATTSSDSIRRANALGALLKFPEAEALPVILQGIQGQPSRVSRAGLEMLAEMDTQKSIAALRQIATQNPDEEVRKIATEVLEEHEAE